MIQLLRQVSGGFDLLQLLFYLCKRQIGIRFLSGLSQYIFKPEMLLFCVNNEVTLRKLWFMLILSVKTQTFSFAHEKLFLVLGSEKDAVLHSSTGNKNLINEAKSQDDNSFPPHAVSHVTAAATADYYWQHTHSCPASSCLLFSDMNRFYQ